MGYDMNMVGRKGEEIDHDEGYFRANIWGMGILRGVMEALDVIDWETDHPPFPDMPEGMEERMESEDSAIAEAAEAEYDKMVLPVLTARSSDPNKVPGFKFCSNDAWHVLPDECKAIATAFKGIDADEIVQAQERMAEALPNLSKVAVVFTDGRKGDEVRELVEYAQKFGDYCARAAEHGGFKVY